MMSSKPLKSVNWSFVGLLGAMLALLFFFWNTPFVYPIKILVVLLHEISHGIAAILTGGSIAKILISPNQGGVCYTAGGWRFLVLSAGYLGSMLWGGLILLAAARTHWDKWITTLMGLCILGVTVFYVRNGFGLVFGIGFGAALFFIGWLLPNFINDFLLKLIGLTSVLYAVFDIKDDLLSTPAGVSDASMMAREFFGSPLFWGILWMGLALIMAIIVLKDLIVIKSSKDSPVIGDFSGNASPGQSQTSLKK
jgi:hypothetical protein